MSVLACSRNGCDNIMCDLQSYDYGYICYDCYAELKETPDVSIYEFMRSPKQYEPLPLVRESWEGYLNQTFVSINDE